MKLQDREVVERKDLTHLPEVKAQRPPSVGYCMASMFCQYEGMDAFQWWANRRAGYWTPYGDVLTGLSPQETAMTLDEAQDLVTDEMLDAAQAAVPDAYRVDAMRIIAAALQVMHSDEQEAQLVVFSDPN